MNFGHIKSIHFVGIGGIGMSGIAEVLTNYDLRISGCDLKASTVTDRLARSGVLVSIGHDARHVASSDLVVVSSAIRPDNPEVLQAREMRIPVIRRAEMLGEIMRLKRGIAVSGTHGKTTTSAMTAMILSEAGLDPTLIVGGVLRNIDTNAKLGRSDYLVVEADEYDRSFLELHPTIAIVTNIEADHLDCYRDLDDIRDAFGQFLRRVPPFGAVIGCADDPNVVEILRTLPKRSIAYGLSAAADLRAEDVRFHSTGSTFRVTAAGKKLGEVTLHIPGEHNIRNSLAAIAAAAEAGVAFDVAAKALSKFRGVERRFQILGETGGTVIVDDYAHHPTEIHATIDAARGSYPGRRVVVLFQPHLFSRTRDFAKDFASALATADVAYVTPIYPAREEPIPGVTSRLITDDAPKNVIAVEGTLDDIRRQLRRELGGNDIFITMGAGDVHRVGEDLVRGAA